MPTIVTHGFVATLLGKSFAVGRMPARFWSLSVLCSILADADVLGFNSLVFVCNRSQASASIVEAESHEAATNLFTQNPHLQIPTSFIEVMEIPHAGL
jgi:hypothetical protein